MEGGCISNHQEAERRRRGRDRAIAIGLPLTLVCIVVALLLWYAALLDPGWGNIILAALVTITALVFGWLTAKAVSKKKQAGTGKCNN
ncbi:MAG: hypothetical protein JW784_06505 [Candidatus Cloacimonetes bacterium]|nr:hypothetical protein [Candidatus Cloacimonadota bacterium]